MLTFRGGETFFKELRVPHEAHDSSRRNRPEVDNRDTKLLASGNRRERHETVRHDARNCRKVRVELRPLVQTSNEVGEGNSHEISGRLAEVPKILGRIGIRRRESIRDRHELEAQREAV